MNSARDANGIGRMKAVRRVEALRADGGTPEEFWPNYLDAAVALVGGCAALIVVRSGGDGVAWKPIVEWAPGKGTAAHAGLVACAGRVADRCTEGGRPVVAELDEKDVLQGSLVAAALALGAEDQAAVALLAVEDAAGQTPADAMWRLALVADTPSVYQLRRLYNQARCDVDRFAGALDLMVLLNGETRFAAAAMTLCNELAARFRCDRVSLGWLKGRYVRVQAISHMEKYEKKMTAVQALEAAMEEGLDQGEEVVWPVPEGSRVITREHEAYALNQSVRHMVSVPLHLDGNVVGMVVGERNAAPFPEPDVKQLRLCADQVARRLNDLYCADRWFGARWLAALRERLTAWSGAEHTLAKIVAGVLAAALLFVALVPLPNRTEAPFTLRGEDVRYLPAPYDSYIDNVFAEKGQPVAPGMVLLTLDNRELLLEEAAAAADLSRYTAEAEKARAENRLAEMRIRQAQADQSRARLNLVRQRLALSEIKAPYDGVVVDGDLKDRVGSPVKQGDVLFKVARLDKLYAQLQLAERDVHLIREGAEGRLAFASQPGLKFPVRVERIEPAAVAREDGNVFLVRCSMPGGIQSWWRPGMTGVAKIQTGRRTCLWMLMHRTADYFRLRFW